METAPDLHRAGAASAPGLIHHAWQHGAVHDTALGMPPQQQCVCAVKVVFVDTLHLFPETLGFLREVEGRYGFEALVYTPKDFSTVEEYREVHGVDLPIRNIAECAALTAMSSPGLLPGQPEHMHAGNVAERAAAVPFSELLCGRPGRMPNYSQFALITCHVSRVQLSVWSFQVVCPCGLWSRRSGVVHILSGYSQGPQYAHNHMYMHGGHEAPSRHDGAASTASSNGGATAASRGEALAVLGRTLLAPSSHTPPA